MGIFQFDFMIRAFMAGIAIAFIAPLIGTYLVVRRYALISDTLAHVALVGVAISLLTGTSPLIVTVIVTVITAIGIEKLRGAKNYFGDSVLALFLFGSLALTAVLISKARFGVDLFSFLFGSISTVQSIDIYLIAGLGIITLISLIIFHKEMFLVSFDEELAASAGVKVKFFNLLLIIMTALVVSLSIRIVGVLLIGALMVIPVMTAMRLGRSFQKTLLMGTGFSLVAVISGLFISYYFDLASGGTIILISLLIFFLVFFWKKR